MKNQPEPFVDADEISTAILEQFVVKTPNEIFTFLASYHRDQHKQLKEARRKHGGGEQSGHIASLCATMIALRDAGRFCLGINPVDSDENPFDYGVEDF